MFTLMLCGVWHVMFVLVVVRQVSVLKVVVLFWVYSVIVWVFILPLVFVVPLNRLNSFVSLICTCAPWMGVAAVSWMRMSRYHCMVMFCLGVGSVSLMKFTLDLLKLTLMK